MFMGNDGTRDGLGFFLMGSTVLCFVPRREDNEFGAMVGICGWGISRIGYERRAICRKFGRWWWIDKNPIHFLNDWLHQLISSRQKNRPHLKGRGL